MSVLERRRFLRVAGAELGIIVAIVAVTAVLINAEPARTELEMEAAMSEGEHGAMTDDEMSGEHKPFEGMVELGGTQATVIVDPAVPGDNTITIAFGPSAEPPAEVTVSASLPTQQIGPLDFTAEPDPAQPGTYLIEDASLSIAGDWELRVEARMGEFDLLTETITVPIQGG